MHQRLGCVLINIKILINLLDEVIIILPKVKLLREVPLNNSLYALEERGITAEPQRALRKRRGVVFFKRPLAQDTKKRKILFGLLWSTKTSAEKKGTFFWANMSFCFRAVNISLPLRLEQVGEV